MKKIGIQGVRKGIEEDRNSEDWKGIEDDRNRTGIEEGRSRMGIEEDED